MIAVLTDDFDIEVMVVDLTIMVVTIIKVVSMIVGSKWSRSAFDRNDRGGGVDMIEMMEVVNPMILTVIKKHKI